MLWSHVPKDTPHSVIIVVFFVHHYDGSLSHIEKFVEICQALLQLHHFVLYKVGYFLLGIVYISLHFSSHIFSLEIWISNSQVPWETATLGEQDDTKWRSLHGKSAHHFNNNEMQSSVRYFLWNKSTILTNSFIFRGVFGFTTRFF